MNRTTNKKRGIQFIIISVLFTISAGLLSYVFLFQHTYLISRVALLQSFMVGIVCGSIHFYITPKLWRNSAKTDMKKWILVSTLIGVIVCFILVFTLEIPHNYLFTPTTDIVIEVPSLKEGGGNMKVNYIYNSYSFVPTDEVTLLDGSSRKGTTFLLNPTESKPARISWHGRVWDRAEFEFSGYEPGKKVFFYQGNHIDVFYFPEETTTTDVVTTLQVHNFWIFNLLSQFSSLFAFFVIIFAILFPFFLRFGNSIVENTIKAYYWLAKGLQSISTLEKGKKFTKWVLWVGVLFFTLWLLNYARVLLFNPNPSEYREGANLVMTEYLLQGKNPFSLESQPLLNTNKGFVYNYTVLPLAMLFGNTLFIHRLVSIFFILLSCLLIYLALRKLNVPHPFALAGGSILFACLLFYVSPIARVDGMGTFLFLAAILIPWFSNFDTKSLVISGFLSILAFYTKSYFILCYGIVAVYVFLFISKKRGFWYGLITLLFIVISIFVVNDVFECYFLHTVINSSSIAGESGSIAYLLRQLFRFVRVLWPIGAVYLIHLIHGKENIGTKKEPLRTPFIKFVNFRNANQPLLTRHKIGYFEMSFLIGTAAIVFLLGQHRGNYMVYLFQLMAPPFILLIFQRLNSKYIFSQITVPLIIVNLAILCFSLLYPNNPQPYVTAWDTLNRYVESSENILNSPLLVAKMIQENMTPIDSGSSEYFYRTQPYKGNYFAPTFQIVEQQGIQYKESLEKKVRNKYFDHIMITENYSPFISYEILAEYYTLIDSVPLYLPQSNQTWVIQIWVPITAEFKS